MNFRSELTELLNRYSQENGSNTPDYILSDYLCNCLHAFDSAVNYRETWYGGSRKGWRRNLNPPDMEWSQPPRTTGDAKDIIP